MAKSLTLAMDLYESSSNTDAFAAYESGILTGLNIMERMIENGQRSIPFGLTKFLESKRYQPLSFHDLIVEIQSTSHVQMHVDIFIDPYIHLCSETHSEYMQGILEGFRTAWEVWAEIYGQTGDWIVTGRLMDKYIRRIRAHAFEMVI